MKINNSITCALVTLGLVSAAGVAKADTTVSIGGQTYAEIFITGSTAFRANIYNAVFATKANGGLFDASGPIGSQPASTSITSGSSNYTVWGTIGGVNYCICFDWSGSEAGLWALQHLANGIPNPISPNVLNSGSAGYPNAVILGTPNPTAFLDPNTGSAFSAQADLAMADTSQAVSLSAPPAYPALKDYGVQGAVVFTWVKGVNSAPDSSWNDISNITDPQANYLLSTTPQVADYFTGNTNDQDDVYVCGRNKASGTHQNTMLDTLHGTTSAVNQWVVNDATYSSAGQLTIGAIESIKTAGGITSVGNDGWDSGGNTAKTLECDAAGFTDSLGYPVVMLGYLSISDALTVQTAGGKWLTLNGVMVNDEAVENGTYSYWGHEHLYGTPTESAAVQAVGHALGGSTALEEFNGTSPGGAIQTGGQLGGNEANPGSTANNGILPQDMAADKPSGGDAGYAAQITL